MKKPVYVFLAMLILCLGGVYVHAEGAASSADYDGLLMRVYRANSVAVLSGKYAGRKIDICEGENRHIVYLEGEVCYDVNPLYGGVRITRGSLDYVIGDDGFYYRFITLDAQPNPWQLIEPELLTEEILGVDQDGAALTITTVKVEPFDRSYFVRNCEVYTEIKVDAETLELTAIRKWMLLPDGEAAIRYTACVENGAECPPEVSGMRFRLYEHLWRRETRTVSFIFGWDYDNEYRISYVVPIGDGFLVDSYRINGVEYTVDETRSTPDKGDRNSDTIFYLSDSLMIRDYTVDSTGIENSKIEKIDFLIFWQTDFSHDDRWRIDIGKDKYLNASRPLRTMDALAAAGEELYEMLAEWGMNDFQTGKYKCMSIWLSQMDGYVLYDFYDNDTTLGGDIAVLVDRTNGEILGCWPGE